MWGVFFFFNQKEKYITWFKRVKFIEIVYVLGVHQQNMHQGYPDETLIRFLKARDWNVGKAHKMVRFVTSILKILLISWRNQIYMLVSFLLKSQIVSVDWLSAMAGRKWDWQHIVGEWNIT